MSPVALQDGSALEGADALEHGGSVNVTAVVKWFSTWRGYGFVVPNNGMGDVMLHISVLKQFESGRTSLLEGSIICVSVAQGESGLFVERILSLDESTGIQPPPRPA